MAADPTTATLPATQSWRRSAPPSSTPSPRAAGSTLILPVGTDQPTLAFVRAQRELRLSSCRWRRSSRQPGHQHGVVPGHQDRSAARLPGVRPRRVGPRPRGTTRCPASKVALSNSEGGIAAASAPNDWIQQGAPGRSTDGPFWTDPYSLLADGTTGVSAWYQDPSSIQVGSRRVRAEADRSHPARRPRRRAWIPRLISATGTVLYGAPQATADFPGAALSSVFTVPQTRFVELAPPHGDHAARHRTHR